MSYRGSKKKEKSSKFNCQDDGHINSWPAVHLYLQGGSTLTSKIAENQILGQKYEIFKNQKQLLGPEKKYFQTLRDIVSSEKLRILEKIKSFSHRNALFFFKKRPGFAHFPRPAETDPYM